jgi:hypothetical protein
MAKRPVRVVLLEEQFAMLEALTEKLGLDSVGQLAQRLVQ